MYIHIKKKKKKTLFHSFPPRRSLERINNFNTLSPPKEPLYLLASSFILGYTFHGTSVSAAFKIFIAFGAQTATCNGINTPEQNPIYAGQKKRKLVPAPYTTPLCNVYVYVLVVHACENTPSYPLPQESKTPACELRGDSRYISRYQVGNTWARA